MLRPTESATVFLRRLGRGLRRTPTKAVLTVLDFIGFHRKEFSFAQRFRALTGDSRSGLERQVQEGFPFLPSGCQIVLDKQAQALVLENIRSQLANRWQQMVSELRAHGEHESTCAPSSTNRYRAERHPAWRQAFLDGASPRSGFADFRGIGFRGSGLKRVRAFAHVDDPGRQRHTPIFWATRTLITPHFRQTSSASHAWCSSRCGLTAEAFESYSAGLEALGREAATRSEIAEVVDYAYGASRHVPIDLEGHLADVPLKIHARYQREEILAALDYPQKPNSFREGVWYSRARNVDAFFVTLMKSEADFSPTTIYADYPISPTLFHWESQSTTSVGSHTGRRYLSGASTVLIFVRHHQTDEFGTAAYLFLGPAKYVTHAGDRPIAITWKLLHAMPAGSSMLPPQSRNRPQQQRPTVLAMVGRRGAR